ncbi:MAG: respiratory nitrate reductase subunit gamma [Desulfobacteraceae bacterium]|nr:respiratory nitrate reductase subunit gamma [Desulfobacteraceae bacterium]
MNVIYQFVAGPLAWAAFILFLSGIFLRMIQLFVKVNQPEKFLLHYFSLRYGLRSIIRWLTPFATTNWRKHPVFTVVTFIFHGCLLITPVFLSGHVVLIDEAWSLSWWTLPDGLADLMTLIVIGSCVFFGIRRIVRPEVRFVTDASDFILLVIVAAPFITGFLAYNQWFGATWMTIAHMLSGQILLAAIPFTRLNHIILFFFSRAYMGSEFGKVRHARDW